MHSIRKFCGDGQERRNIKLLQPLIVVSVGLIVAACGNMASRNIVIEYDKCWPLIYRGDKVAGTAILFYYPEVRAFVSNSACLKQNIGVGAGNGQGVFIILNRAIEQRSSALGVSVNVNIEGKIRTVKGSNNKIVSVSAMKIVSWKSLKFID